MFNTEARIATLEEDWEGKWFSIVARLFPNKLTFQGVGLSGWETDESQSVQVALALPRDDGLTSVIPRQLGGPDGTAPWPSTSAHVSFAGPVDLDTFHIKEGVWPEPLIKTSVFVKLGSYLQPENDRPPRKGIHICHVLVLFPVDQQPWKSLAGWMRTAANPFTKGSWIACSGRLVGVLDRDLIRGSQLVDSSVRILVILADNWEFIRQNSLSTNNTPTSKSSNLVDKSPTTPRPAGPGGVASRNPFSSPNRAQNPTSSPQIRSSASMVTPKTTERETTALAASPGAPVASIAADPAPMFTVPSSDDDSSNDGSDTEQLLEAQIASSSSTPTKKRKEPSSPEPTRSKRSTAGKKKARLYD